MMRTRRIFGMALCKPWQQSSIHMVPFGTVSAVIYQCFFPRRIVMQVRRLTRFGVFFLLLFIKKKKKTVRATESTRA